MFSQRIFWRRPTHRRLRYFSFHFVSAIRFISYEPSTVKIRGLGKQNAVAGKGYLRWHVKDHCGRSVELRVPGYHVPGCGICLLPPQYLTYYSSSRNLGESRDKVTSYPWLCQHTPSFPVSLLALLSAHPDSHPVGPVKSFACCSFIASGGLSRYCVAEGRSPASGNAQLR